MADTNKVFQPVRVTMSKEEVKETVDKAKKLTKDWDYLEFVDDLHHIANHDDLDNEKKLKSLVMMINKQYELVFGKDK